MDQWLAFAPALAAGTGLMAAAAQANDFLATRTYLVGHRLTLADIAVWGELAGATPLAPLFPRPSSATTHDRPCHVQRRLNTGWRNPRAEQSFCRRVRVPGA